ncbi:MAG: hypothetical protein ACK40X_10650, partial [Armatimonadota bacterium]
RYKTMLLQSKLTRAEKQGRRAVSWTHEELTRNLGVSASQRDAIVNRLRGMGLLKVREVSTKEGRKLQVTFTQHPLEQKLREWIEEFGKKVTVTVGESKREVKEIAISELRQRARRWGAYKEEIEAAVDLTQARGILERTNDKVRQTVFIEDPEAIRQEAEKLRESLEPLSPHFREDVRRFEEQLDKIVELTYAGDEGQHEEARHLLGDLYAALKEFALQKAEQLARDAHELERKARERLTRLPLKEVERKVELSLRIAEWLDDQRRQLQKKLQRVSDELQKAVNEVGRIAQQTEIVRRAEETRERLERLRTVAEQMQKLRKQVNDVLQQTEALGAYVDGFVQWKALAEEADNFRGDLPDRYADLCQRFDEWQESVMEHFAEQQQEALKEHEKFRLELDELRRELAKRQQGERDAFAGLKEAYEKLFIAITEHRLNTPYDPADPEGSYERLFNEVMERFGSAFDKLNELIQQDRSRVSFLKVIRQQDVSELEREVAKLDEQLQQFTQALTFEIVKSFRDGDDRLTKLCEEIRQWISRRGDLVRRIQQLDKPQKLDDGTEKAMMELLREVASKQRGSGGVSLAQVWEAATRNGTIPPEQLLNLIERLYRKGWIEIIVSERKYWEGVAPAEPYGSCRTFRVSRRFALPMI